MATNSASILFEDGFTKVQLYKQTEQEQPLVIKSYKRSKKGIPSDQALLNEFEVTKKLDLPGIRKTLKVENFEGLPSLFLEYVPGINLQTYYLQNDLTIDETLRIACSITKIIGELHVNGVIHKDLNPTNCIINETTGEVRLIDFSISSVVNHNAQIKRSAHLIEGSLPYISPEQTGRMNRQIDFRSDFYSLGILLYELFTGRLPFSSSEPLKIIHQHIARLPDPPHLIVPDIPKMISRIILKLLQKDAENRYQSAGGILYDLSRCLKEFNQKKTIIPFELGQEDHPNVFKIPEKLYGRVEETKLLYTAYQRASTGLSELVLVSGYSGIGKSALINELHKPITEKAGYFISGKFNEYQTNVPFQAFLEAFKDFAESILSEEEDHLKYWKKLIQEAVGKNGKILTDSISNFKTILGKQAELAVLGAVETQNRFNLTIKNFIKSISRPNHPLLIFLDDLQWADIASLNLLKTLISIEGNENLLLLGAYRDNEVNETHPLSTLLDELKGKGIQFTTLNLQPLKEVHVNEMVEDTLKTDSSKTHELSKLIYEKTNGNPFFLKEFLKSIYQKELFVYDHQKTHWTWDIYKIRELNITDNVVALMRQKIKTLSHKTQTYLQYGACLGTRFQLSHLVSIFNIRALLLLNSLEEAIQSGLIIPGTYYYRALELRNDQIQSDRSSFFKFPHDRVRQAFYFQIPEAELPKVHLQIANILKESHENNVTQEVPLFDIANHFIKGASLLRDEDEKLQTATIHLRAGNKAREGGAYLSAMEYYQAGIDLLPQYSWETAYELTHALYENACTAAYSSAHFSEMQKYANEVLKKSRNTIDKAKTYKILITRFNGNSEFSAALNTIIEALQNVGFKMSEKPSVLAVLKTMVSLRLKLINKSIGKLENLPTMTDEKALAIMDLLYSAFPIGYQLGRPLLLAFIVGKSIHVSLKYGIAPQSAMALSMHGIMLLSGLNDFKNGIAFNDLALRLERKNNDRRWFPFLAASYYTIIGHLKSHEKESITSFRYAHQVGIETGNVYSGSTSLTSAIIHSFWIGNNLDELGKEAALACVEIKSFNQITWVYWTGIYHQTIDNLQVEGQLWEMDGKFFHEKEALPHFEKSGEKTVLFAYHLSKFYLAFLYGNIEIAQEQAQIALSYKNAVPGMFQYVVFMFYLAVFYAQNAKQTPIKKLKKAYLKKANKYLKKIKKYERFAAVNFSNKVLLIRAVIEEAQENIGEAGLLFSQSISKAEEAGFVNEEALAAEMAGQLYLSNKDAKLGHYYILQAETYWRKWGAVAKANHLKSKYQHVFSDDVESIQVDEDLAERRTLHPGEITENLDLDSILKANISISGEIILEQLIASLLEIVIENAGAQRGFIILKKDQKLIISGGKDHSIPLELPPDTNAFGSELLAESVVQFVSRTKKHLILKDANRDLKFSRDAYISSHKVKSVICIPVIHQNNLLGMIYLENNLTTNAFTDDRIELLRLLSGQIAVSLNNALLYENLEQKVRDRTKEIETEKKKSDNLLLNILPKSTAEELKKYGKTKARKFDNVAILFTDFVDFTQMAEMLPPEELIEELDHVFSQFDKIITKHGLEKIKTIGDAYMCVCGLPTPNEFSSEKAVLAGLEILEYLKTHREKNQKCNKPALNVRIGIHSGTVVAGVVGLKKFAFDIWGDDVNIASRMESSGAANRINISGTTHELVKEKFNCEYRGKMKAKNKGNIDMYFVERK
ncbi:MAG: AAA family ATPase [Bacteroidetes bacterium]|nr:AAA family ATPase [Bacteroidota bacterium]